MRAVDPATMERSSRLAAPAGAAAASPSGAATRGRRTTGEKTSLRAVITSSAFLVLFAICLMVGGHAAIDPLLRSAMAAREPKRAGDIIYTLPDGRFCRHVSFDNATAEVVEGKIGPCPDDLARREFHGHRGFAWGSDSVPSGR